MIPANYLSRLLIPATLVALGLGVANAQDRPAATQPTVAPPAASQPASQPSDAKSLLRSTEERYAKAKTYRDEGVVHLKMITKPSTIEDERPFSTVFKRNGRFRWEFRSGVMPGEKPTSRYVIWSRDQKIFDSWWDLTRKHDHQESLDRALAGPTGISGGSATAVIPMLTPTHWGPKSTALQNPTVKGTEKIQGVDCTIVEGQALSGDTVRLWIDSSFALRQIFYSREIDPAKLPKHKGEPAGVAQDKFVAETTITITPTLDAPIPDKDFEFTPPGE